MHAVAQAGQVLAVHHQVLALFQASAHLQAHSQAVQVIGVVHVHAVV